MSFTDRYGPWVLVAGVSQGLGAQLALGAADRGCSVALDERTRSTLDKVTVHIERTYDVQTRALPTDLNAPGATQRVLDDVQDLEIGPFKGISK